MIRASLISVVPVVRGERIAGPFQEFPTRPFPSAPEVKRLTEPTGSPMCAEGHKSKGIYSCPLKVIIALSNICFKKLLSFLPL